MVAQTWGKHMSAAAAGGTLSGRNEGRSLSRQPCDSLRLCSALQHKSAASRLVFIAGNSRGLQHNSRFSPRRPRVLWLPALLVRTSAATIYRDMIIFFSFFHVRIGTVLQNRQIPIRIRYAITIIQLN
jgi:hypothetical protein